jgi:hypothetical protein
VFEQAQEEGRIFAMQVARDEEGKAFLLGQMLFGGVLPLTVATESFEGTAADSGTGDGLIPEVGDQYDDSNLHDGWRGR